MSTSTGFVLIGDPGDDACAVNTLKSGLTLTNNTGGFEAVGNSIAGTVSATGNSGHGPFAEDNGVELEGNTIHGGLSCSGNSAVTNDGNTNTVTGAKTGQCAAV